MYTVVLMAALSSGSAAPDWHRGGGHHRVASGCVGYYGCYGCYGGGAYGGGAYGGPMAYGGHCLGTWGGYSVSGPNPAYGCWGGWSSNAGLTVYSGPGSYGYGYGVGVGPGYGVNYGISFQCHGCYGCYGGWSCYGSPVSPVFTNWMGAPVPSNEPAIDPNAPGAPKAPEAPLPKGAMRSNVIIELPENAKLYVDDIPMKDGSTQRAFQTPLLDPAQVYFYDIRVEVTNNGKVSTDRQRIVIRPGQTVTAAFNDPDRPAVVTLRNTPPPQ
jgi:uncharacterized protein (TIGR03000 family)